MNAYVAVEGFLTKSGFILKELCIFYDDDAFDHYIFKEPTWSRELTNRDLKTIHYITSQLNGLHLYDGSIPYNEINGILECIRGCNIYTFSDLAVKTLRQYLPDTKKIKNIQDLGFEMPKQLPTSHCFRTHKVLNPEQYFLSPRYRYCAKAKAREVRDFMRCFD
jgi:hypothetical protein